MFHVSKHSLRFKMYVVDDWKNKTQMHLNANHAFLNNNIHKGISRFSKTLV